MKKSDIIIKQVPLFLEWYESSYDKEKGVYYGGVVLPKYTDELCIDIYDDYLFNFKKDDFEKTGRHVLDIGGSSRAMRELGKFFVNFAMHKCNKDNVFEVVENIGHSPNNYDVRMFFYRTNIVKRMLSYVSGKKRKVFSDVKCIQKTPYVQKGTIALELASFKEGKDRETGIIYGGICDPKHLNELIVDVVENDEKNRFDVCFAGTKRAVKSFGELLINFSLYMSTCDGYHIHHDGIRGYNYRKNVNIIIRKS